MESIDILTKKEGNVHIFIPEIVNASLFSKGGTILKVDQHFNWFQKLMWKRSFGIKVNVLR